MGKCFLGLWFGVLTGLSYFVSEFCYGQYSADLGWCLSGAAEWVLTGAALTVIAAAGYGLYSACERRTEASRPTCCH